MPRIKAILKNQSEEGFALVISIGFALIVIVIALTLMGRSFKDSSVSNAQKTTSRSLSVAEAGVTRYLAFINKHRYIATHPDCQSRGANGTCNDSGSTASWANPVAIQNLSCSPTNTEIISQSQTLTWQDLDPGDPSKGQYKLVSYSYTPGTPEGQGFLVIDGRIDPQGSGNTATSDVQTGNTRLQVNVPITPSIFTNIPFPGLWVNNTPSSGANVFQANVLLGCGNTGTVQVSGNSSSGQPYSVQATTFKIPNVPAKPASFPPSNILGDVTSDLILPRATDVATEENINGVLTKIYRYAVSSIGLTGTRNLTVNTIVPAIVPSVSSPPVPQKVILYLDGDMSVNGNATLQHNCQDTNGTTVSNCDLTNLQIYGYKANGQICTSGNGYLDSFIFAPTYRVGVSGSGTSGGFRGAIWSNTWDNGNACGSNTGQVVLQQSDGWEQLTPFIGNVLPPQPGAINSWKVLPSSS